MSTMRNLLVRIAGLKAIEDQVKAATAAAKAELMAEVGGRMGATAAVLPGDLEAATVSVSKGKGAKVVVVDERAFTAWVKTERPTAIIETVRKSDQEDLLAKAAANGELPPGCDLSEPGKPYVAVRQSEEQLANLVDAFHAGTLDLGSIVPELGAARQDGAA